MNWTLTLAITALGVLIFGLVLARNGPTVIIQFGLGVAMWALGMMTREIIPPGGISTGTQLIFAAAMLFWWTMAAREWRRSGFGSTGAMRR